MSSRGEYYRNKYGRGRGGRGRGNGYPRVYHQDEMTENRNVESVVPSVGHLNAAELTWQRLGNTLIGIDKRNYGSYHALERVFTFSQSTLSFKLAFDFIQGDPYASPSRAHVVVHPASAGFPAEMYTSKIRNIALCDYLTRQFARAARNSGADAKTRSNSWHGAKGGDISIDTPGQHVIERSSVMVHVDGAVEARFNINLPARGRSICGDWAYTILVETLPCLVENALLLSNLDEKDVWQHLHSIEDQESLRMMLSSANLVGFVCNDAILPRESGASDLPLDKTKAIAFRSPPSLVRSFTLPNRGEITGMGIPSGITLFVGGGFHGKTTILKALEVGVYNHIPGDGREFVVMDPNAVKIRSEDSRSVQCTDISAFIDNLPFQQKTIQFTTTDASGSTSQAANIMEALEVGATTLLIDEDTCATNFMIRDWKMQQLVVTEKEPITPYISKVRALYTQYQVSSVLVIGGAGDYFSVADHVIMMDSYTPRDVTVEAKAIASRGPAVRQCREFGSLGHPRIPLARGFDVAGHKIRSYGMDRIQFGEIELELGAVEQIVEPSQVRAIADIIVKAQTYMDGKRTLKDVLESIEAEIDQTNSLDGISVHRKSGFYSRPRRFEIAAAVNRLRSATFSQ